MFFTSSGVADGYPSCLAFITLLLREAHSRKLVATCGCNFLQGDRVSTGAAYTFRRRTSASFVVWTKMGLCFGLCLKRLCL